MDKVLLLSLPMFYQKNFDKIIKIKKWLFIKYDFYEKKIKKDYTKSSNS